jgi:phage FluMu protein Com
MKKSLYKSIKMFYTVAKLKEPGCMQEVRCRCNKLLGRINGDYEIKCSRCKAMISGSTIKQEENIANERTRELNCK